MLGLLGYGAIAVLLTCLVREAPAGRSFAVLRMLLLVPGVWALWFLASLGPADNCAGDQCVPTIVLSEGTRQEAVVLNGTAVDVVTLREGAAIYLESEAWWMWHWALGIILFIFVLVQAMQLLARPPAGARE